MKYLIKKSLAAKIVTKRPIAHVCNISLYKQTKCSYTDKKLTQQNLTSQL